MEHLIDGIDENATMMIILEEGGRGRLSHRCEQRTSSGRCRGEATARFLWPGAKEWARACEPHAGGAERIADALGFKLQREPLPPIKTVEPEPQGTRFDLLEVD